MTNRERIALFVRRCDQQGLQQWIAATPFTHPDQPAHLERLLLEEVAKASPEVQAFWEGDGCPCGEPATHEIDPARLYSHNDRFYNHADLLTLIAEDS